MRVVLDANIFISAVISDQGNPSEILRRWEERDFELVTSPSILEEVRRVIHYPKIQERYRLPKDAVQDLLALLRNQTVLVEPQVALDILERDSDDNRYLACAVAGLADYIVSGDAHLLDLESYEGVEILSPIAFLTLLRIQERL
jgi:hypothetical protein